MNDEEQSTENLRKVLRSINQRHERRKLIRRIFLQHKLYIYVFLISALGSFIIMMSSPWPATVTVRHIGSFPSCSYARFFHLAPAEKGEPGYYARHDADGDGVACEPWP